MRSFLYFNAAILGIFAVNLPLYPVKADLDVWGGYNYSFKPTAIVSACDTYASANDDCRYGGFSFGVGSAIPLGTRFAAGIGLAYLPIAYGTLKYSTSQTLSVNNSYVPVLLQARLNVRWFYAQLGAGYSITVSSPKVTPYVTTNFSSAGLYTAMAELGISLVLSEHTSFFVAGKAFGFYSTDTTTFSYSVSPVIGFRANLTDR